MKKIALLTFDGNKNFDNLLMYLNDKFKVIEIDIFSSLKNQINILDRNNIQLVITSGEYVYQHIAILEECRIRKLKTLNIMDGVSEWRNSFARGFDHTEIVEYPPKHPFMCPSICDYIACLGNAQKRVLHFMGNDSGVFVTGAPRIDLFIEEFAKLECSFDYILVASARNPAFNNSQKKKLLSFYKSLKKYLLKRGEKVKWRLSDYLAQELGVINSHDSLASDIASASCVLTTPSTLCLETMAIGKPLVQLNPFNVPLLVQASWTINSESDFSMIGNNLSGEKLRMQYQANLLSDQLCYGSSAQNIVNLVALIIDSRELEYRSGGVSPALNALSYEEIFPNYNDIIKQDNIENCIRVNLLSRIQELENLVKERQK